ncbi:MAG: TonB-dependent receptor [Lewinellaceae bacterium]|nr:TonB-dependent receptor [Lewinellaceae bacterium]
MLWHQRVSQFRISGNHSLQCPAETGNLTSYEAGLDIRFLKNRIGLDFTFYNSETENQIVQVPMNWATGYSAAFLNSGKVRNRGWKLRGTAKISAQKISPNTTT